MPSISSMKLYVYSQAAISHIANEVSSMKGDAKGLSAEAFVQLLAQRRNCCALPQVGADAR